MQEWCTQATLYFMDLGIWENQMLLSSHKALGNTALHHTHIPCHVQYNNCTVFSQSKVHSHLAPLISMCCLTEETAWGFLRLY
jgi:hypothetical protein